jgi:hypothetical protein
MNKKWLLVLVPFIVVALFMSCDLFGTPDYIGTWKATLSTGPVVTMVFEETTFSVTVVTVDATATPVTYVITGDLAESATAGELEATITGISQNGTALDAATMAGFLAQLGLSADQTFTYSVDAETITISGALLLALTQATSITATKV